MKLRNLLGLAELFQPELNIFECDYTLQGETELYFVNLEPSSGRAILVFS